jgi:hypothetical protein
MFDFGNEIRCFFTKIGKRYGFHRSASLSVHLNVHSQERTVKAAIALPTGQAAIAARAINIIIENS